MLNYNFGICMPQIFSLLARIPQNENFLYFKATVIASKVSKAKERRNCADFLLQLSEH